MRRCNHVPTKETCLTNHLPRGKAGKPVKDSIRSQESSVSKVLSVRELRKEFGRTVAVDGITFDVGRNEIVGLLGPNGAGKTTTINMILSVLEPSSGTISIEGLNIATHRSQALERTNFAATYAPLPGNLTAYQNLRVFGLLYGVKNLTERIELLLKQFDLEAISRCKVRGALLRRTNSHMSSQSHAQSVRTCFFSMSRPRRSIPPPLARCASRSASLLSKADAACYGPHTTCTKWKTCATVCSFSHEEEYCLKVTRSPCPTSTAKKPSRTYLSPSLGNRSHLGWDKAMNINRIAAIVLRQFYLIRGSLSRVLPMFAWIVIDIVLWGFITKYLNALTSSSFNFVPTLLGAVLLWDFFMRVMQGVTLAFFEDVWSRNFLNIFAAPVSIWEYVSGLVISSIATSSVGLIVMLVLASTVFGLSFFAYGIALIPFLLILFLFGIALGILASAMVLRLGPASEWFVWPIPALISPFAGVFYPLSTLPQWMQYLSYLLPPSYVFEAMRGIISGGPVSQTGLLWGGCLALLYVLLACRFFVRHLSSCLAHRYYRPFQRRNFELGFHRQLLSRFNTLIVADGDATPRFSPQR